MHSEDTHNNVVRFRCFPMSIDRNNWLHANVISYDVISKTIVHNDYHIRFVTQITLIANYENARAVPINYREGARRSRERERRRARHAQ